MNLYSVLVGVKINAAIMEISLDISPKKKKTQKSKILLLDSIF